MTCDPRRKKKHTLVELHTTMDYRRLLEALKIDLHIPTRAPDSVPDLA